MVPALALTEPPAAESAALPRLNRAAAPLNSAPAANDSLYSFTTGRGFLTMKDGVRLAVTWWRPVPRSRSEKFPVLLELLPYRKDDSFYARDYPLYSYFVRRGFLLAKVDVRGTGGSQGHLPPREYSDGELDDADEIIRQLAQVPGSNGNVGMWGISWGGFNAIQVAMRRPPALKAILALHASDDLYHDDVHYIDGGLHLDPYILEIDHENALPRTPDYPLDSAYFRDRFDAYPWVLTYLHQPVDGEFWRRHALRDHYDAIQIPCYLIGGLLDGYRDTPLRMLEHMRVPLKVDIGPWVHDWPDDGTPGPNYEWRALAVRWWNQWLRGQDTGILAEPRFTVFVRSGHAPDATRTETPGYWRGEDWPIAATRWDTLYPGEGARLLDTLTASPSPTAAVARLKYVPGSGTAGGDWWGEPTGDMRRDDAGSLVFDRTVVGEALELIGSPVVRLRTSVDAPLATWTARLEDVLPDGSVSLVTGAVINGTQYRSTLEPERLEPGREYDLSIQLHFTTWTFQPGHRIRLAVSNAQFPMIWPAPYPLTMQLRLESAGTALLLPLVPPPEGAAPDLPPPEPREERADVRDLDPPVPPSQRVSYDPVHAVTSVDWVEPFAWTIGRTRYDVIEHEYYEAHERDPADSRFLGVESHRIRRAGQDLQLRTTIDIRSDSAAFRVSFTRRLEQGGRLVREKVWRESIPRIYH